MSIQFIRDLAEYLFLEGLPGIAITFWPFITPLVVLCTIGCFIYRRSRWVAPFWIFLALPNFLLIISSIRFLPNIISDSAHPYAVLCLSVPIMGFAQLLAYPRGGAWGRHAIIPTFLGIFFSLIATNLCCLIYIPPN